MKKECVLIAVSLLLFVSASHPVKDFNKEMVSIPGGSFMMGSENGLEDEKPVHPVTVKSFLIDKYLVTVGDFRKFVQATGFVTDAEKFGNSIAYNFKLKEWQLIDGADWKHPSGKNSSITSDNLPVTQVSWRDAFAYASWKNKRLPTEEEWEFAARKGTGDSDRYSWGNELIVNGKYYANVWTGDFPDTNTLEDGYFLTSPVGSFKPSKAGLYDMGGNVWEWCSTTYHLYSDSLSNDSIKVVRGGSFMCDKKVCHGYRITSRMFNSFETSTFHTGFRCAKSL